MDDALKVGARALRASEDALQWMNETLEDEAQIRTAELDRAPGVPSHAQKMEALAELTAGIAHDFNNLLTGIIGGLDLARTRLGQTHVTKAEIDEARNYLDIALDFGGRADALTRRLLAFARRESLGLTLVDLAGLVLGLESLIRRTVGADVCVVLDGVEGLWAVRANASEVENALLNLAINARDAMPHGGRLTVRGYNVSLGRDAADVLGLPPGDFVMLSLSDTGDGMAPEVAAHVFEPFFTTKPLGKGTGLGLSVIYRFARTCGGHVSLDTRRGEGTTVRIYLPRYVEGSGAFA
jgi:signal transduction histidine kinase